jgi:L-alanine-DL-glutamate epimerase-like enolase superfamily enzyme
MRSWSVFPLPATLAGENAKLLHLSRLPRSSAPCLTEHADQSATPCSGRLSIPLVTSPASLTKLNSILWTCCKLRTHGPAWKWHCGTCWGKFVPNQYGVFSVTSNLIPYASQLFGDTPAETLYLAQKARNDHFQAVKFGWGPIGKTDLKADIAQFQAAREGLGPDGILLVDTGQIFGEDVEVAAARLPALEAVNARWLEEPFHTGALNSYGALAARSKKVKLAGGEGAHNFYMAQHLIDFGRVGYIQVDCGRIGGIGPAKRVADYAVARGVTFVNHTFTSHLALSASLQPYAGLRNHDICEFPFAPKSLAREFTANHLARDTNGFVTLPDAPGLGVQIDVAAARKYLVDVQISAKGKQLFTSTGNF